MIDQLCLGSYQTGSHGDYFGVPAPYVYLAAGALAVWVVVMWGLLTEGTYLGSRFVRLDYDLLARWYEAKWNCEAYASAELTRALFVEPVLEIVADMPQARVLDLACGTGRGSLVLMAENRFAGSIDAIDFSSRMLSRFRGHLADLPKSVSDRVTLYQQDLTGWRASGSEGRTRPDLPNIPTFAKYDVVLFLEAAELIPDTERILSEACRSLKPDGLLLTTLVGHRFRWLFWNRSQSLEALSQYLIKCGMNDIRRHPWRARYDVVTARKQPPRECREAININTGESVEVGLA